MGWIALIALVFLDGVESLVNTILMTAALTLAYMVEHAM